MKRMIQFNDTQQTVIEQDLIIGARKRISIEFTNERWVVRKVEKHWFKPNKEIGEHVHDKVIHHCILVSLRDKCDKELDYKDDVNTRDADLVRISKL